MDSTPDSQTLRAPPIGPLQGGMESPSESQAFKVPDATYVAVEYPGYVRNMERAMETLGGLPSVAAAMSAQASYLKVNYRPDDPNSHPILGDRKESRNLLLRISRKRGTAGGSEGDEAPTVKCVARVNTTFRFDGLCDYQYLPIDSGEERRQTRSQAFSCNPTPPTQMQDTSGGSEGSVAPTVKFVARVNTTFRYGRLCDYQYLPIDSGED
eukprot:gene25869-11539_t